MWEKIVELYLQTDAAISDLGPSFIALFLMLYLICEKFNELIKNIFGSSEIRVLRSTYKEINSNLSEYTKTSNQLIRSLIGRLDNI